MESDAYLWDNETFKTQMDQIPDPHLRHLGQELMTFGKSMATAVTDIRALNANLGSRHESLVDLRERSGGSASGFVDALSQGWRIAQTMVGFARDFKERRDDIARHLAFLLIVDKEKYPQALALLAGQAPLHRHLAEVLEKEAVSVEGKRYLDFHPEVPIARRRLAASYRAAAKDIQLCLEIAEQL